MSSIALEVIIILLLILVNGLFAMSEIAVVSSRKARLQQAADEGDARAKTALELASHPLGFLATVQVGISLAGILAGVFGGATIAERLAGVLATIPVLAPYSQAISVGVVVLTITYLSLVLGELAPKRLALANPERIAALVAGPLRAMAAVARPLVRFLSASTNLVTRALGVHSVDQTAVTPEEIRILIEQGTQTGVFEEAEQDMIESVLHLDERRVGSLMTPRTQITWIDVDDTAEVIRQKVTSSRHSRFPVSEGSLENVLGILRTKDLLAQSLACLPLDLRSILQAPLFVPETTSALRMLELFKEQKRHIALVTDEFGSIQGVVTHNDILEAVVGVMPSAGEPAGPGAVRRADGSWLVDGMMDLDTFRALFEIEELPDEALGIYQTLGGLAMHQIGAIPVVGQAFAWQGFRFEVVDMDGRRVDKVLVQPPVTPGPQPNPAR
jgi:putative hemolysin